MEGRTSRKAPVEGRTSRRIPKDAPPPTVEDLAARLAALEGEVRALSSGKRAAAKGGDKVALVVFSGTLDKILAAMTIATGAASMGCAVHVFFTFWGTPAMRRGALSGKKTTVEKMFGMMLPAGTGKLKLSTMNWGGIGASMIKKRMKEKGIADLDQLFAMAAETGVQISICEMSMDLMGMTMDDMREYPGLQQCGVGTFMSHALDSNVTLFI